MSIPISIPAGLKEGPRLIHLERHPTKYQTVRVHVVACLRPLPLPLRRRHLPLRRCLP